jgi:hypothetical protein
MARRLVLAVLSLLALMALGTASASACSLLYVSPKARVRSADLAIFGHVAWVHPRGRLPGRVGERFEAKIRISRVYKGRTGPALRIRGDTDEAACGASKLRAGQRVSLLLYRPGPPYSISLGSLSSIAELSQATGGRFHRPGRT